MLLDSKLYRMKRSFFAFTFPEGLRQEQSVLLPALTAEGKSVKGRTAHRSLAADLRNRSPAQALLTERAGSPGSYVASTGSVAIRQHRLCSMGR